MLGTQEYSSLQAILKSFPGGLLHTKERNDFLPKSFISSFAPQPALRVLFFRLFTLNPQSL
jgi:hypothetical protein